MMCKLQTKNSFIVYFACANGLFVMEHISQKKSVEGEVYKKTSIFKKETKHHVQDSYSEEVPSALSTSINANTISIYFYNVS